MALARYSNRRDANEPQIVYELEAIGALVIRMDEPCDLLVKYEGRVYLLEVNNPNAANAKYRKRTKKQLDFLNLWDIPIVESGYEAMLHIGCEVIGDYAVVGRVIA